MNKFNQSLDKLIEALKKGQPVSANANGEWFVQGFFRALFSSEDRRVVRLAQAFASSLDQIEKHPVRFNAAQTIAFDKFLEAADIILGLLKNQNDSQIAKVKFQLQRRVIALKYRLEGINGGLDEETDQEHNRNLLEKMAADWKLNEVVFSDKELTGEDLEKIELAARHREFADLLIQDQAARQEFFTWAMRDRNEVKPYIQFPATQQKIASSNLQGRIGRMGGEQLQISVQDADGVQEKILTLPFEGQMINILNDQTVITFRGNFKLTIAEVFEVFRNKNTRVGDLEFLKDGITNWNVHELGWWNADKNAYEVVDISKPGWWKQLPFLEILTKKQAKNRYGLHLDGITWSAAASATRGSASLDFDQTHAFLEMAIPMTNGKYAIYDFGKFATQFPSSFMEVLSMLCRTVPATVAFPDENIYYTHRQHALHSFALTPDQGLKLMDSIRRDLIKARAGNLVYQIESENCAKWLHEKLEGVLGYLPNLFKMHILDTEPVGFVSVIFELIKKLPRNLQIPVLTALHLPLGATQEAWILENGKLIARSLTTHEFWETGVIYLPAFLHKQLETGALEAIYEKATTSKQNHAPASRGIHFHLSFLVSPVASAAEALLNTLTPLKNMAAQARTSVSICSVRAFKYSYILAAA